MPTNTDKDLPAAFRRARELKAQGKTLPQIAETLNDENYACMKQNDTPIPWTDRQLQHVPLG